MVRHKFSGPGSTLGMWIFLGFRLYAMNLSEFIQVVVVARKESQPAVQAASCAAASRLCRHSAQTHTPYNASVLSRVFFLKILKIQLAPFCISRKMLQNEYLVANIGVDTAENGPRKE